LGSTGSGKTTLANLLPRFYEYTKGRILLDGVELKQYPRKFLRSQIGIVEQEPFLFSRTIGENITYGIDREVSQEEIETAIKEFLGIEHIIWLSGASREFCDLVGSSTDLHIDGYARFTDEWQEIASRYLSDDVATFVFIGFQEYPLMANRLRRLFDELNCIVWAN